MTIDERLDRLEHVTAGWIDQSRRERAEDRQRYGEAQTAQRHDLVQAASLRERLPGGHGTDQEKGASGRAHGDRGAGHARGEYFRRGQLGLEPLSRISKRPVLVNGGERRRSRTGVGHKAGP